MEIFYTYFWLRYDGTPYYIGKGQGKRAFGVGGHRVNPPKDKAYILIQMHPSERAALDAEIFFIAYYGRKDLHTGCLRNQTNGGDKGASGLSSEVRAKMGVIHLGNKNSLGRKASAETCAKISAAKLGKPAWNKDIPMSKEQKSKLSVINKGKPSPNIGRRASAEAVAKNRAAKQGNKYRLGKKASIETIAKLKASHLGQNIGKKLSAESIAKRTATRKRNSP
jgi:hypothetical protein